MPKTITIIDPLITGEIKYSNETESVSFEYLISPVISGSIIVIVFGIILNKFIAKRNYPK